MDAYNTQYQEIKSLVWNKIITSIQKTITEYKKLRLETDEIPWTCATKLDTTIPGLVSGPVGLAQNLRYINLLDKPVEVKISTGSVHTLPPVSKDMVKGLEPGWIYIVSETSDFYNGKYNHSLGDTSQPVISNYQLRQSIAYRVDVKAADHNGILYDFRFHTIFSLNVGNYFQNTDPVPFNWMSTHNPYFRRGLISGGEESRTLDIGIFVVDNTAKDVEYYINLYGKVYKITAVTTKGAYAPFGDGVYVVSNRDSKTGMQRIERYNLNDCIVSNQTSRSDLTSPILLFHSARDAQLNGNEREIARQEAARAEREVIKLKEIIAKSDHKRKLQEGILQTKSAERKDYYESRSMSRKDHSEGISSTGKAIAAVASVVGAIFGMVKLLC